LINKTELGVINKMMSDNLLFYKTKLTQEHFTDILAKTLFYEIGKSMTTTEFSVLEKNIMNDFKRKEIVNLSSEILDRASDSKENINELIRKFSYKLDQVKFDSDDDLEFHSMKELVDIEIEYQNSDEVEALVPIGWNILDDEIGGVPRPSTNYVLAFPKIGKSMSLYDMSNKGIISGKNILFVTIEIPTKEASRKMYANYTNLNYRGIAEKELSSADEKFYRKNISDMSNKYDQNFYMIYNKNGVDIKQIEGYIDNLKKSGIEIDTIFIDYLTLLNSVDGKKKSDVEKFMALPKELRVLSQKTNTAIISAGQLDVSAMKKTIEEISLDDMHYVKNALSQEATNVLFLNKEEALLPNGKPMLKIKHLLGRNGISDHIYHFPNYEYNNVYLGKDKQDDSSDREASF